MKKFASLLTSKWTSSLGTREIYGQWAEDDNCYIIKAPPQLVDAIVAMQNYVFYMNKEITDREKCIDRLTKELEEMKIACGYRG